MALNPHFQFSQDMPITNYKINQNGVEIITMERADEVRYILSYTAGEDVVFRCEIPELPADLEKITMHDVIEMAGDYSR